MRYRKGWMILLVLAILSPLGALAIGEAWGEWGIEAIEKATGIRPKGMEKAVESVPRAPLGAGITAGAAFGIARMVKHGRIS
jgi:hypothetical protein